MYGFLLSLLGVFTSAGWLGLGLGAGLGVLYGVSSLLASRYALRQSHRRFLLVVVMGMVTRMGVTLVLVALIVLLLPVEQVAFFASFLSIFVIGIIVEVMVLHRKLLLSKDS